MKKFLILLFFAFLLFSCGNSDEGCTDSIECPGSQICEDGVCVDKDDSTGDSSDTGNTSDSGNTGDSGDSGNSGNSGDSGNSGNTGNSNQSSVCGNGIKEAGEICDDGENNGRYGFCKSDCSGPGDRCGDEIVQPEREVCDGNRAICSEMEGMGYVNDAEAFCTTFCDGWVTTDCKCATGFEKDEYDNEICKDIDECLQETDNCTKDGGVCVNTEGSFECECAENYEGDGLTCEFCGDNDKCGADCSPCQEETPNCMDNGDGTSQCVECYKDEQCDTEAGEVCTALNKCSLCPLPLTLATWDGDDDEGWSKEGAWRRESKKMLWGSSNKYSTKYSHNLVYNEKINLTHCVDAGISFEIGLNDDINWEGEAGTDKNQRLYVECSGDDGANWVNMIPPTLPDAQTKSKGCTEYYCDGNKNVDRTFSMTEQIWKFPSDCLAPGGKVRFRADGTSAWELQSVGWMVDTVEAKEF